MFNPLTAYHEVGHAVVGDAVGKPWRNLTVRADTSGWCALAPSRGDDTLVGTYRRLLVEVAGFVSENLCSLPDPEPRVSSRLPPDPSDREGDVRDAWRAALLYSAETNEDAQLVVRWA